MSQGQSSYQYQITQQIPDEWSQFYYGNVDVTAALPGSILDYKVTDADGNDVTSYFTNNSTGNQLNLAATADTLQNADFYGQRYIFTVTVSAPADTTSFDQYTVHSTTTIDGIAKDSGTTTTTLFNQHQITVHYYKKGTTEKLAPDEIVTVVDGQTYATPEKTFKGYKFSSQINTTGVYDGDVEAIYYYAIQKGVVHIYYVMDTGGEIRKDTITGNVGEKYTVDAIEFEDSKDFILKGPDSVSGIFSENNQTITFVYQVPRVHYSVNKGLDVYKVLYADGSLKYVKVDDGDFEITFVRDSNKRSVIAIQSMEWESLGKVAYLSNKETINFGRRFGYFNTKNYGYIFEKSYGGNRVKVVKINKNDGNVSVQIVNLNSPKYKINGVLENLGIRQSYSFKSFWEHLINKNDYDKFLSYHRNVYSSQGDKLNRHTKKEGLIKEEVEEKYMALPQTSERRGNTSIYGYLVFFLTSVLVLFRKGGKKL
ncbi:MucBP domain-containing protein [Levilactobacillus brevis]|uniref:MucBP domain-containing protein n=1 Tax=Levilactobacillus brevis TaxID=1580 RepID=UPI001F18DCC8|nr:MucBP domain-containing protein [Levilactobacillus brevis]